MRIQEVADSPRGSLVLQRHVLETVGQLMNSRHTVREGFSETSSVEPGSESIADESDDCWVHMLEYSPPRWSNFS